MSKASFKSMKFFHKKHSRLEIATKEKGLIISDQAFVRFHFSESITADSNLVECSNLALEDPVLRSCTMHPRQLDPSKARHHSMESYLD
jgi:hypothetical protein